MNNFTTAAHISTNPRNIFWGSKTHHTVNGCYNIDFFVFNLGSNSCFFNTLFFTCFPTVCGKFTSFSPNNLTETQWPWHAAIYIRSPPDPSSTAQPPGVAMFVQQGDSEESTFWVLACSGALLSQRSILVAAHCVVDGDKQQTLPPAQVRVVMGVHDQTSRDQRKSLRRLTVPPFSRLSPFPFSAQAK